MKKHFQTDELLARLRALGRRNIEINKSGNISFREAIFNPQTLIIKCNENEVKLSLKESQILEMLIQRSKMIKYLKISKN